VWRQETKTIAHIETIPHFARFMNMMDSIESDADIKPAAAEMALFRFPCEIGAMQSVSQVGAALLHRIKPLGFDTYVIGAVPRPDNPNPTPFIVDNLSPGFWDAYFAGEMTTRDPALRAVNLTCAPVSFQQIRDGGAGFVPAPEELAVLDLAAGYGQPHGLIVPVFRAQGYRGVVALTGPGPDPVGPVRTILQFLANHAHDRMRKLFVTGTSPADKPVLSPREIELMALALRGLNDEEIAVAAGITVRTVRFHFENVRRKFQARSRAEAIATAVNLHLIPV